MVNRFVLNSVSSFPNIQKNMKKVTIANKLEGGDGLASRISNQDVSQLKTLK